MSNTTEAPAAQPHLPEGLALIIAERCRQIGKLGWTPAKDDVFTQEQLVRAAICYLKSNAGIPLEPNEWPFPDYPMNVEDSIRNLAKAGALVAAEIDRVMRARRRAIVREGV